MKPKATKGDNKEKISGLLAELSEAELKRYFETLLTTYPDIEKHFIATFAAKASDVTAEYKKIISSPCNHFAPATDLFITARHRPRSRRWCSF